MPNNYAATAEEALRAAMETFHKIVSDHVARKILDRSRHKMPQILYDDLVGKLLEPAVVEKIAADGFETRVRALATMGATDVSIHECGERELEQW